ncbi:hypothetical protein [Microscilla marina]|uniref:STAS/SEC14 domain-containing protein n=1 Tax=Microscilla marina ATCC 23134 TaxID=313606 RepID=A1ZZW6_MICM2|nr:hypothetical protein [Microscilla marina]EAY24082.1 hypothetical protein M23134_02702 [Microscilla marina ATCC 23134]
MMTLKDNKYTSITLDTTIPALITFIKKPMIGQSFRKEFEDGLMLYAQKSRELDQLGWIINFGKMSAFKADDQDWMHNEWNRTLAKAGLTHLAIVMPESIFGQIAVKRYVAQKAEFTIQLFDKFEEARQWLDKTNKTIWLREA